MLPPLHVVTGAFGFIGAAIAKRLLERGLRVRTLTGHPERPNSFGERVSVAPYNFDAAEALCESLRGADVLYNTYWVRFEHGSVTFARAVENSKTLIRAAEEAGVRRIVHISIANATEESPFPYFRGKALVEKAIRQSTLSYAIIGPAVVFGAGSILLNNIAWLLRRFSFFVIPGSGEYRLQPVCVDDVAELAARAAQADENLIMDAVGPETYTFNELVRLIAERVRSQARILHLPPALAYLFSRFVSYAMRDVLITGEEIAGLMAELLVAPGPPTCVTPFSDWLGENAASLGLRYLSELALHYRRVPVPSPLMGEG